jgi:hypothetical protein
VRPLLKLTGFTVFGEARRELVQADVVEELGEEKLAVSPAPVEETRMRMIGLEPGREA